MKYTRLVCFAAGLWLLSGCATAPPHAVGLGDELARERPVATDSSVQSLFSGDAALLSDADIARILAYKYLPPERARVGVLGLGQQLWFGYSDELARSGEDLRRDLLATLKQAPPVAEASFLPGLLVPSNRSVAHYREAAARTQSDLLLIYQASCRTYEKFRMFRASEAKAFCTVEALLLDVRTGIVPFTNTVTRELLIVESKDDFSIYETRRRSELNAIRDALNQVAGAVVAYLSNGS
jgi:hypothetical protein